MSEFAFRERVHATPAQVFQQLISKGRITVNLRTSAVSHEQIGEIRTVDGLLHLQGDGVDCRLDPALVDSIFLGRARGKRPRPKLVLLDAAGELLLSVLCQDDPAVFDAAIRVLHCSPPENEPPPPLRAPTPVGPDEPGRLALDLAAASDTPVTIVLGQAGVTSTWRGMVGQLDIGPNAINIKQPGFHLHLRGGFTKSWDRREVDGRLELSAQGEDGAPIGLTISGIMPAMAD